ncbi:MAG: GTPase domain-containing protein, partial [Rhodospirillales bacterium]|nr:GTPase domain-containing protein [Rhodospirillales bacterium]
MRSELHDHLNALREALPRLAAALHLETGELLAAWCKAVDSRLLARFDPAFPLVAAVCGGGSSGKSTLFNSLSGGRFSPVGGRAGMNRRVLFAVPERAAGAAAFVAGLIEPSAPPA